MAEYTFQIPVLFSVIFITHLKNTFLSSNLLFEHFLDGSMINSVEKYLVCELFFFTIALDFPPSPRLVPYLHGNNGQIVDLLSALISH